MENISQIIFNELEKDLCENAQSTFIVSGGSSPVQIFKDLSAMEAKWSDINISLVDDRVVDINHEDSNEKFPNFHLSSTRRSLGCCPMPIFRHWFIDICFGTITGCLMKIL